MTFETVPSESPADEITLLNVALHGNTKRAELIEECDKNLEKAKYELGRSSTYRGGYAEIATAYCTRALLEEK